MLHNREFQVSIFTALIVVTQPCIAELVVEQNGSQTAIRLSNGAVFRTTNNAVSSQQCIDVPNSATILALWNEQPPSSALEPYFGVARVERALPGIAPRLKRWAER